MKVESKFNLGDKVVVIEHSNRSKKTDCELCNTKGTITLIDGKTIECPKCRGTGYVNKYEGAKWNIRGTFEIKGILIETKSIETKQITEVVYGSYDNLGCLFEFGEQRAFSSIEEAQRECDLRNESK